MRQALALAAADAAATPVPGQAPLAADPVAPAADAASPVPRRAPLAADPAAPAADAAAPSVPGRAPLAADPVAPAADAATPVPRRAPTADVPVGALVIGPDGAVVAAASNRRERDHDPTAHAEVVALRAASAALGRWRLDDCTVVVTLEPCAMCAGALIAARVERVVFGAWDAKAGACGSVWDLPRDRASLHRPDVIGGVLADECAALLAAFFDRRRR
jgi:tRNA(adenine34) deaminase